MMRLLTKARIIAMLVIISSLVFLGCQEGAIKKKKIVTAEQEQIQQEEDKRKSFEETLRPKRYPGIEGEVLESSLLRDINFEFDRYDLTEQARQILTENAKVLLANPTLVIQIEGHCDERGSNEYNLALGEKRADSAKKYLIKLGVAPERLSTISYGEELPLDPRHNEEAWAKNRRCHFVILSR